MVVCGVWGRGGRPNCNRPAAAAGPGATRKGLGGQASTATPGKILKQNINETNPYKVEFKTLREVTCPIYFSPKTSNGPRVNTHPWYKRFVQIKNKYKVH